MPRYAEIEVVEDDFNKFTDLVRAQSAGGEPERGDRRRTSTAASAIASCAARTGSAATSCAPPRRLGRARAAARDRPRRLHARGGGDPSPRCPAQLAEGLRRALLFAALADAPSDATPGLILLAPGQHDREREPRRRGVAGGVRRLPAGDPHRRRARARGRRRAVDGAAADAVGALADRARLDARRSRGGDPGGAARARAGAADRRPYGLTDRERAVTQLVAQGLSTNDIGARLFLSP